MSFEDGWSAINLNMPSRIPHTEYSVAEMHWDVIRAVTDTKVNDDSSEALKTEARIALRKAWNFDFNWNVCIFGGEFGDFKTDMGHALYTADGHDMRQPSKCVFETPEEVFNFDPFEQYGAKDKTLLTKRFESDYKNRKKECPFEVNMTGIYITMVSGLLDILGWDMLLLAAGTDPQKFGQFANRYTKWIQQYFDALAQGDYPIVMIHDDMVWSSGPFVNPSWYREFIFPNIKKLLAPLKEAGKKIAFTCDGDFTLFIDDLVECGVDGFVLEPMTDMSYIAEKYGQSHFFIGNADTRILLNGTKGSIRAEVERCINIGRNCPGFFMAVGNQIPPNTPTENVLYYNDIYQKLSRR